MKEMKSRLVRRVILMFGILLILTIFAVILGKLAARKYVSVDVAAMQTEQQASADTFAGITKIVLAQKKLEMVVGDSTELSATLYYDSIAEKYEGVRKESLRWRSENPEVAVVNDSGVVQAVSKGITNIVVSNRRGTINVLCVAEVSDPYNEVASVSLDRRQIRMNVGDKRKLFADVTYVSIDKKRKGETLVWRTENKDIATVNRKGIVTGHKEGTTYITVTSKFSKQSGRCKVVVGETKYIAITFDDGPGPYTDRLLDAFDKNRSKATFFVLGNRAQQYGQQLQREKDMHMEIGSHTYSHVDLSTLSADEIQSEISKTNDAVKSVIGEKPTLLRPPYGSYNKTVQEKAGVPLIMWCTDTLDWKYRDSEYVCKFLLDNVRDGDIVLLHDIHETSVEGAIAALPKLRKKGFEMVTVSELYMIKGVEMEAGTSYNGVH